jgi:catechol 2,3-dioxygenase-like lactoylglutathione lyase family enzyme
MIALTVEDWYEALDFYRDLLGLELLESDEGRGRARLRAAGGLWLELRSGGWGAERPKGPRESPVTLCFRASNLSRYLWELEQRGVLLLAEPEHGAALLADPEGNLVCLYEGEIPPPTPDGWRLRELLEDAPAPGVDEPAM